MGVFTPHYKKPKTPRTNTGLLSPDRKTPKTGPSAADYVRSKREAAHRRARPGECEECGKRISKKSQFCSPKCAKAAA